MTKQQLVIFSPAGVVADGAAVRRAARYLGQRGFGVQVDPGALARHQRFAGTDDARLEAIHRVAQQGVDGEVCVALATRGGYGLTRLLDRIDWPLLARSVEAGLRWVGYSDMTALQLGAIAHKAAGPERVAHRHADGHAHGHEHDHEDGPHEAQDDAAHDAHACDHAGGWWAGPMACGDFGLAAPAEVDDVTEGCFLEAMDGQLEAVGFRTDDGHDGLEAKGRLWGGNLCVLTSLLGTPHFPRIKGGVLFLEDVNEHPYRIERSLLQLHQAGVLDAQKAVVLGQFTEFSKSPLDRGYGLKSAIAQLRSVCSVPLLTGLPFGHVPTKVSLPLGRRVTLLVQGRDAFIGW